MKLTIPLCSPPKFHFWKDFGAGFRRRRYPFHKYWNNYWKRSILNAKIRDERLQPDQLPENARVVKAEDLVNIQLPETSNVEFYNHPWPFNIEEDHVEKRPKVYAYNHLTRFYRPEKDALTLTNTLMEPSLDVPCNPHLDLLTHELEIVNKRYLWSIKEDSSLFRLPRSKEYPRIDQRPRAKFGIPENRAELNVLTTLDDFVGTLIAQRCQKINADLDNLISRRSISYPNSVVPLERDGHTINLCLSNDLVSLSKTPIPLMNQTPEVTLERPLVSIHPRSWRSILDETNQYYDNYKFRLPVDSHIHTLMLASRNLRILSEFESFAQSLMHAYGMATQMARLYKNAGPFVKRSPHSLLTSEINNLDQLEKPICLQTIVYNVKTESFHFTRFQLNSIKLDSNIKNQAWYSGPITNFEEVLKFWIDFHAYGLARSESISLSVSQ